MNLTIKNRTSYQLDILINSNTYKLKNGNDVLSVEVPNENVEILLKNNKKSFVHLNFLDILLGLFFGDSTYAVLYYDYRFSVKEQNEGDVQIEILCNDLILRPQLALKSCYAKSKSAVIEDIDYFAPSLDKIKRKHKMLHLFAASLLLVGLALFVLLFLVSPPFFIFFLIAIWLFIYAVPSFKEIRKFKKDTNPECASRNLKESAQKSRNAEDSEYETSSKTGKLFVNIINKMFKFDEDK